MELCNKQTNVTVIYLPSLSALFQWLREGLNWIKSNFVQSATFDGVDINKLGTQLHIPAASRIQMRPPTGDIHTWLNELGDGFYDDRRKRRSYFVYR